MLEFHSADRDGVHVVAFVGEAGVGEARELSAMMIRLAAARSPRLVLDLSKLSFISSLAIGELASLAGGLRRFDCRLATAGANALVDAALKRVRMDQRYEMFATLEGALAALGD